MRKKKTMMSRRFTVGVMAIALMAFGATAFGQSTDKSYPKDGWQASASTKGAEAANAIDGDANTRWDTGGKQVPGQWFMVDLGKVQPVSAVVLDYEKSHDDGPRAYALAVSEDGAKWETVVESKDKAPQNQLEITLDKAVKARFIKIDQQGSTGGTFWSIHEISVYK